MKKRIIGIAAVFSLAVILASVLLYFSASGVNSGDEKSEYIVALNEIQNLTQNKDYGGAAEKIQILQENIRKSENRQSGKTAVPVLCGISLLFFWISFGYVYFEILSPFEKMKEFAAKISAGDFDVLLKFQRSNYFGEFTWAFDSMRNEITKSRASEREAIENNKTVIATLSHDIKTPISSIRAYCEGLSANMDSTFEKRERYISVIIKKCDEVSRLTDDLFLHSVSDLDKLKVSLEAVEICDFTEKVIKEIGGERDDVIFEKPSFTALVNTDKNRFSQLCGNIINNARKYAKTDINVFLTMEEDNVVLHFRDYGGGIPDENMPFIFDKFYRGNNCADEQGSGLGLYIVKYIVEKTGGKVILKNHSQGLEVKIFLPVINS